MKKINNADIVSINTNNPILAMQSWLIKTPNRPNGIEFEKLMKMSEGELTKQYKKLNGENKNDRR